MEVAGAADPQRQPRQRRRGALPHKGGGHGGASILNRGAADEQPDGSEGGPGARRGVRLRRKELGR